MGAKSKIEWTEATWNCLRGCSRVSEGCRNCYAEAVAARFSQPGQAYHGLAVMKDSGPHWTGKVELVESALDLPLRWRKPRRIFVNSMSDLFHESAEIRWTDKIFAIMVASPQHTFQVLTKRAENMQRYMREAEQGVYEAGEALAGKKGWCHANEDSPWPPKNVWLGVSVEDANQIDRVRLLQETPAAIRFISYEPALALVDFSHHLKGIHWVIVGGESGPQARPFDVAWARSSIAQCKAAGVPCFVKQMGTDAWESGDGDHGPNAGNRLLLRDRKGGDPAEWPADLRVREYPNHTGGNT